MLSCEALKKWECENARRHGLPKRPLNSPMFLQAGRRSPQINCAPQASSKPLELGPCQGHAVAFMLTSLSECMIEPLTKITGRLRSLEHQQNDRELLNFRAIHLTPRLQRMYATRTQPPVFRLAPDFRQQYSSTSSDLLI
ncbi:hypothetical protein PILCRDRAFT_623274 [Piloderma croceum F 1598]|uniref:Uncharacterized protein n=1 Tax=Piloderma croceum (strain F 1598) TaxID=765440 RepID=A0A0C3FBU0_PILCF|nr:hypothetical protein PILCRDRAFT_623274 [Piloderma croceum F 1598]